MRRLLLGSTLLAALTLGGLAAYQRQEISTLRHDTERLALLERENERLRTEVQSAESARMDRDDAKQRVEIEQTTAKIRQLPFKKPVKYAVLRRAEIGRVLEKKLRETITDEEIRRATLGYVAMGFLPAGIDLKAVYISLLGEQIAAFYDQFDETLYLFENSPLSSAQNRIILAHELTHALQDQNFDLDRFPLNLKDNDDRALAASALVEGDATLVMSQFMRKHIDASAALEMVGGAFSQQIKQLTDAPRYLREGLLFPYLKGQEFCVTLQAAGGFPAVSKAYQRLPSSSAQILNPAAYAAGIGDEPELADWTVGKVGGALPTTSNVAGEFGIRCLVAEWVSEKEAPLSGQGWRGDRYAVFGDAVAWSLVWRTRWESPEAAKKFAQLAQRILAKRHGLTLPATLESNGARAISVWSDGPETVVIDAATPAWRDDLRKVANGL